MVPACRECNGGYSLDEEYLACLIDCVVTGNTEPSAVGRPKIQRILNDKPALMKRLAKARSALEEVVHFSPESERVGNVILKLARAHAAFELNEPTYDPPTLLNFMPLHLLADAQRAYFETSPEASIWPEMGSRTMQRMTHPGHLMAGWNIVQDERYRYLAALDEGIILIRMVMSEYLAAEVIWSFI